MSENKISKPDANPVAAAILCWFVLNLGHLVINGQQRKFMFTWIAMIIGTILCCVPGWLIGVLSAVEAYQTATRLKNGEEIGENEYTNELMFKVVRLIDKTATCATIDNN